MSANISDLSRKVLAAIKESDAETVIENVNAVYAKYGKPAIPEDKNYVIRRSWQLMHDKEITADGI